MWLAAGACVAVLSMWWSRMTLYSYSCCGWKLRQLGSHVRLINRVVWGQGPYCRNNVTCHIGVLVTLLKQRSDFRQIWSIIRFKTIFIITNSCNYY